MSWHFISFVWDVSQALNTPHVILTQLKFLCHGLSQFKSSPKATTLMDKTTTNFTNLTHQLFLNCVPFERKFFYVIFSLKMRTPTVILGIGVSGNMLRLVLTLVSLRYHIYYWFL